jgi:hypothetical protein
MLSSAAIVGLSVQWVSGRPPSLYLDARREGQPYATCQRIQNERKPLELRVRPGPERSRHLRGLCPPRIPELFKLRAAHVLPAMGKRASMFSIPWQPQISDPAFSCVVCCPWGLRLVRLHPCAHDRHGATLQLIGLSFRARPRLTLGICGVQDALPLLPLFEGG